MRHVGDLSQDLQRHLVNWRLTRDTWLIPTERWTAWLTQRRERILYYWCFNLLSFKVACYTVLANWYMSMYKHLFLQRRKVSEKLNCIIHMDKLWIIFKRGSVIFVKKNLKQGNIVLLLKLNTGKKSLSLEIGLNELPGKEYSQCTQHSSFNSNMEIKLTKPYGFIL